MDPQTNPRSPAQNPYQHQQRHGAACDDPIALIGLSARYLGRKELLPWLKDQLGKQTRCQTHEGRRWWVWENPDYILYAHPDGHLDLHVPDGVTQQQVSEAVLWDLGILDRVLTRADHKHWFEVGVKLAEPHIYPLASKSQDKLKQFVLDYCDGQIFCDFQIRNPSDAAMVFMPIALGCFSEQGPDPEKGVEASPAWLAQQELPPLPGKQPERGPAPPEPEKPPYPDGPDRPKAVEVDSEEVARLILLDDHPDTQVAGVGDLFSNDASGTAAVAAYRETIRLKNEEQDAAYAQEVAIWEAAKAQVDADHLEALAQHQKAVEQWEATHASFDDVLKSWEIEKARAQAASQGFTSTRYRNIGVIYEYMSQAGPRSINGHPIFYSLRMLNKDDWQRARAAIERELKRREDLEI